MQRKSALLAGLVASLASALVLLGATAQPAAAAVNGYIETLSSATTCNSATRTMNLGISLSLTSPYVNGLYISQRFRYYQVNAAGARTSTTYTGNFTNPVLVKSWSKKLDIMGTYWVNNPIFVGGGTVTWTGRVNAEVQIGIWTGSSYVYTGWIDLRSLNSYTNYYPTSLGMQSAQGSACMLSY